MTLLGRPGLVHAVAGDGLRVTGHTEGTARMKTVSALPGRVFDGVFVTCKAHATSDAAPVATAAAGDGVVASLQNGIGNDRKLLECTPRVAGCLTSHGVTRIGPAHVHHAGTGATVVGAPVGGDPTAARQAKGWLADAGLSPAWTDDLQGAVWTKAAVNAAINPLGAIHGKTNGGLLTDHWDEARALALELGSLGRAAGVGLHQDPVAATRATLQATAQNRCSMLQDVEARRPTEIDQITGYFMRAARRLGYPLHRNEDTYRRVVAIETAYLGEDAVLRRARREAEAWRLP